MKSFKFNDDGDWILNEMVEGDDELIQCLKHLIYTRVGEWFLNEVYGFQRDVIEVKKADERDIVEAVSDAIYQEPRISEIVSIDYNLDKIKRKLTLNFVARTVEDNEVGGDIDVDLARI
ncbi:hypothetical protein [Heyndrickxia oleronia]|uniref:hypothetical protein n=1 Tax=Heyndrickxia oleronia TaxID=38875 RepID=UPI001C0F0926|nr:hypothetical protein [Heyndrickxia oleronia]MBU5214348.1 hypothetical protein [Heyndrickxia oleronia]